MKLEFNSNITQNIQNHISKYTDKILMQTQNI